MVGMRSLRVGLVGTAVLVLVLLVAAQPVLGQTVPDFGMFLRVI